MNIDFFTMDPRNNQPWAYPATLLFGVSLHELHHHKAPFITLDTPEVIRRISSPGLAEIQYNEGMRGYSLKPGQPLSPMSCPETYRDSLEEAVIEDSTEKILRTFGLRADYYMNQSGYNIVVERYQRMVINPLFGGEYLTLLRYQQATQRKEFFELIGERLGHPEETRYAKAYNYLFPNTEVVRS